MELSCEFYDGKLDITTKLYSVEDINLILGILDNAKSLFEPNTIKQQSTSTDEIIESALHMAKMLGKNGGIARASKLSPERRREIAKIAANKRWSKPID